ncbi:MAG: tetratricopeptide repeat protein, partial [Deltaproteobacteria bacterium]|nr:tetratricopeptide repeat protein [Deltaproteobacteria bacterium]
VDLAHQRLARRGTPLHRLALAEALAATGRIDEAQRELATVLDSAPNLAAAHSLAARLPALESR